MWAKKLYRQLQLWKNPLKKGDVLYGDCCEFFMRSRVQQVWHGLVDWEGNTVRTYWRGDDTYRLTIESIGMPYYVMKGEVLTRKMDEEGRFVWQESRQKRRIGKAKIDAMILTGKLKRV